MITRYVPALNGTAFLGMLPHQGRTESHYVKNSDFEKVEVELDNLKSDNARYIQLNTEQQVEIEHLRSLLRGVGFGEL